MKEMINKGAESVIVSGIDGNLNLVFKLNQRDKLCQQRNFCFVVQAEAVK